MEGVTGAQSLPRSPASATTPASGRKNFTMADDLTLRCVNLVRSWEATMGTANGIMKAFDVIEDKGRAVEDFVKKDGPALPTRFDRLVHILREDQHKSMRSSGASEQEKSEEAKARERAKMQGIDSSGELMRRLAMGELADEGDVDELDVNLGDEMDASSEAGGENSAASTRADATQTSGSSKKRAAPRRP
ncbi:hypothetical protein PC128_g24416 [Phytophthora cactorum]|nr:hypothetical protein PC128_g24416 [Phytophthora cactorum]